MLRWISRRWAAYRKAAKDADIMELEHRIAVLEKTVELKDAEIEFLAQAEETHLKLLDRMIATHGFATGQTKPRDA